MVAILGTTISPYLFFWQAGQEIEEQHRHHAKPLCMTAARAGPELKRIRIDTLIGMAFSYDRILAIVFATAATLNANGSHRHRNVGAGGRGAAPDRRPVRLRDVRSWDHRHRPARGAGARGLGRLCGDRDGRQGRQPGREAASAPLVLRDDRGDDAWPGPRSTSSASIRHGRSTGRLWSTAFSPAPLMADDDADCPQQAGDGTADRVPTADVGRMGGYCGHGGRLAAFPRVRDYRLRRLTVGELYIAGFAFDRK